VRRSGAMHLGWVESPGLGYSGSDLSDGEYEDPCLPHFAGAPPLLRACVLDAHHRFSPPKPPACQLQRPTAARSRALFSLPTSGFDSWPQPPTPPPPHPPGRRRQQRAHFVRAACQTDASSDSSCKEG